MVEYKNVRLHHIDCMEFMKDKPDNYWELAIVDPPYSLKRFQNGIGKNERHTVKTKDAVWNNNAPTKEYFDILFSVSKNQIIWGANNFNVPMSEYFCVWDKMQTVDNFASAEYAFVSPGLKTPAKVFRYSIHQHNSNANKIHPTQKPVKLYRWLLKNYAKEGDKILDTHAGSFSSAIACYLEGFEYDGCEIDEDYFKAGSERFLTATKQENLFA